jgi:UDP-2-acetamido-3-amino-2,3-dideoxy-glucuronate N-acetyltransferase
VSRKAELAHTLVCKGVTVGANATVICGVTIGEYAMIGAGAVVTHDIAPHAIVVGSPARQIGWACRCGETLPHELACARCESVFRVDDNKLVNAHDTLRT